MKKVKVNQSPKINLNPQSQTNPNNRPPQNLTNQSDQINALLQQLQQLLQSNINNKHEIQQQNPQPQLQNNGEFIIKANMKSSYVAARIESLLMAKKKVTLSGLGFAIPIVVDSVLLIRKDLNTLGVNVNIQNIELFEREITVDGRKKIISGIRVTLSV